MQKGYTHLQRLKKTLFNLWASPQLTFLFKIRKFVHNFIFKKQKKTLIKGL